MAETYVVIANIYNDDDDAIEDFNEVKALYDEWGAVDTFDAAVITKDDHGKVSVVKRREEPVVQGGTLGAVTGLALGAVAALFPAVTIGAALLVGTGAGAAIGAITGHVVAGLSRHDLKELGELLDEGQTAFVVVAAVDVEARVAAAIKRADKQVKKELKADQKALREDIDSQSA
ncbi:MAG: DUF1269 domain-containing protein [Mycetocola sp.]